MGFRFVAIVVAIALMGGAAAGSCPPAGSVATAPDAGELGDELIATAPDAAVVAIVPLPRAAAVAPVPLATLTPRDHVEALFRPPRG